MPSIQKKIGPRTLLRIIIEPRAHRYLSERGVCDHLISVLAASVRSESIEVGTHSTLPRRLNGYA